VSLLSCKNDSLLWFCVCGCDMSLFSCRLSDIINADKSDANENRSDRRGVVSKHSRCVRHLISGHFLGQVLYVRRIRTALWVDRKRYYSDGLESIFGTPICEGPSTPFAPHGEKSEGFH
jgi:hypothetical protein